MTTEEIDTIGILRQRCREYRELLIVAASLIKEMSKENDCKPKARQLFMRECKKHGIVREGKPHELI